MSLYYLKGINPNICRQVFILVKRSNIQSTAVSVPVNDPVVRRKHDGLFQMVKKRTLEARTKVNQSNTQNQYQKPNQASSSNASRASSPSSFHSAYPSQTPFPPFSKGVKTSANAFAKQNNVRDSENSGYHNVRVLGATGCDGKNEKPRTAPAGCGHLQSQKKPDAAKEGECSTDYGGGGGRGDDRGDDPGGSKLPKALLLLLAALGAGGLIYWLSGRGSKEEDAATDIPPCPPKEKKPDNQANVPPPNLPHHVPYLLIGGGTAAFSAFRAIKSNDARAKVLMITNENRKPYMRPPLSKELWYTAKSGEANPDYRFKQWTGAERSLFFEPEEFFIEPGKLLENANGGIAVAQGMTVKRIDPTHRKVFLKNGMEIEYDQCLIATGCSPKNLPVFQNSSPGVKERVMVYRTPEDFERLKHYADQNKSIMIVGNGFIGSELACSLATYTKCKESKIFQVFAESGNMSRVLPDYLSKWTTRKVESQGVCVIPNVSIRAAQRDESTLKITLSNGNSILTDVVVVCVGCDPNTTLAYSSGLEVHPELGGFVVNAELEARQNLFVAGDASCFYDPLLGRRRVEHHDHSVVSGRLAGENMVGKKKPYSHQSMFWSDLGPEIGYEAIGLVDSSLPTVGVFALSSNLERSAKDDKLSEVHAETTGVRLQNANNATVAASCDNSEDSYAKGVIFYLKNDKIVGILLWNLFNRIGLARTILNQDKKYDDLNEVAKLFEIHAT